MCYMSSYKILKSKKMSSSHLELIPIREEDIEKIRIWRNQQREILRQNNTISKEDQEKYFEEFIKPTFQQKFPEMLLFSIILKGKCIGYGGLVHINWEAKRAEISFLSETKRAKTKASLSNDFENFLEIILDVGFTELKLNKITTETFEFRREIISILEKRGFEEEGILKKHVIKKGIHYDSKIHCMFRENYVKKIIKNEKNILVTSISNKTTLLEQIKKSVCEFEFNVRVFGGDSNRNCVGRYFVDDFWQMPYIEKLKINDLVKFCKKNKIKFIIPTRDGELDYFAKNKSKLLKNNIFTMVSPEKTVNFCLDKISFFKNGRKVGIPVIKTSEKILDISAKHYVVKERFGSGSQLIGLNLTKKDAEKHAALLKEPIFQPFVKGEEYSIDAYITKTRKIQGIVIRKRNLIVNGESKISETIDNKRLENLCKKIVKNFNFFGHIVLQVIIDSKNKIHIIECNCRFGGASTLSIEMGLNSFNWFIKEGIAQKLEGQITKIPKKTLIRYSKDMFIN